VDTKLTDEEFPLKVAEPTADWHVPDRELAPRNDNLWQRVLAWVFFVTGFAFFLFVRSSVTTEVAFTVATSEALVLMGISQVLLIYIYRRISNNVEPGTGFRRLHTKVPESADLPVQVEILRDGCMTGRDKGYIWLAEGTWYFKGLQTAFRFNQQDIVPIEAWPRSIAPDPHRDKPPRTLPMKSQLGHLVLRVDVLDPFEDYAKRKRVKGFYREMYDWLRERPRGAIESLLPPTAVHPSLVRTDPARFEGLAASGVMVLLDTMVLLGLPHDGGETNLGSYALVAAAAVTLLLFLALRFGWQETRDLSVRARLAKAEAPSLDDGP
jgi:hypothetical protein